MEKRVLTPQFRGILFSVIRCGMEVEDPSLSVSSDECDVLLHFGDRQSILPIVYNGLKRLSAPKESLQKFDMTRLQYIYNAIQRDEAIKRISNTLSKEELPHILLKGAVLRDLYPQPDMRTSCDIDILVHEEDLDRAIAAIETETGFIQLRRSYHDVSMLSSKYHLELHFSLKENARNIDRLLCRAWEFAEPEGEGRRYRFTPEYLLFHVTAHMYYHFLHGGLGIRPFIDLWLLRSKTVFSEERVRAMCAECGILVFYEECCRLSQVWMQNAEPTETSALLEQFCLSGGVFGLQAFKTAARQREHRGLQYVLSRVFPPAYQVKEYYADSSGKKHILPYYYIKRLASWTGKERRVNLQTQLHQVFSSDSAYLDSADDLFERLGLR